MATWTWCSIYAKCKLECWKICSTRMNIFKKQNKNNWALSVEKMNWSSFYQKQIWYILVLEKRNEIKQREIKAWRGLNSCLKIDLFCSFSKAQPGSCGRVQAQRGVHQHGCGRGSAVFCCHEAPLLQVTSTFVLLSLSSSSSLFPSSCLMSGIALICERQSNV